MLEQYALALFDLNLSWAHIVLIFTLFLLLVLWLLSTALVFFNYSTSELHIISINYHIMRAISSLQDVIDNCAVIPADFALLLVDAFAIIVLFSCSLAWSVVLRILLFTLFLPLVRLAFMIFLPRGLALYIFYLSSACVLCTFFVLSTRLLMLLQLFAVNSEAH